MYTIILAAGRGARLGPLTSGMPKALVQVAGNPLIAHATRFARQAGTSRLVVVGGYHFDQLQRVMQQVDPDALLVENPDLHAGNLLSLVRGHAELDAGGFLLMNTDHIYPQPVAHLVAATAAEAREVTAFCDFDRTLGPDDMKVRLVARKVADMSKSLSAWDAGYVGMTYVPSSARERYTDAIQRTRVDHGDNSSVEQVLVGLAQNKTPPEIADISGHGWFEVDEPHERERAERGLRAAKGS